MLNTCGIVVVMIGTAAFGGLAPEVGPREFGPFVVQDFRFVSASTSAGGVIRRPFDDDAEGTGWEACVNVLATGEAASACQDTYPGATACAQFDQNNPQRFWYGELEATNTNADALSSFGLKVSIGDEKCYHMVLRFTARMTSEHASVRVRVVDLTREGCERVLYTSTIDGSQFWPPFVDVPRLHVFNLPPGVYLITLSAGSSGGTQEASWVSDMMCCINVGPVPPSKGKQNQCCCPGDFNKDCQVDYFDYLDFISFYGEESPCADFNGDGEVDFWDYLDFLDAWAAWCP